MEPDPRLEVELKVLDAAAAAILRPLRLMVLLRESSMVLCQALDVDVDPEAVAEVEPAAGSTLPVDGAKSGTWDASLAILGTL